MSEKVYYNENLEKMLNHYIKEEKYGGFKPLLNEIFQRRAYEFGFDEKQMKKQIKNFVKRTPKVEFGKNISPRLEGCYNAMDSKGFVFLNSEHILYQLKTVDWLETYQSLVHEVYHAISNNSDGRRIISRFKHNNSCP